MFFLRLGLRPGGFGAAFNWLSRRGEWGAEAFFPQKGGLMPPTVPSPPGNPPLYMCLTSTIPTAWQVRRWGSAKAILMGRILFY